MNNSWKYDEARILDELADYVDETYDEHYEGADGVSLVDVLHAVGRLEDFSVGSIIKYAMRFGRKDGTNRRDLLKLMHYAMLVMWELDEKRKTGSAPDGDKDIG